MKNFAPIVVFCYIKLNSLKKLFQSLKRNKNYKNHRIIIFSDGPKNSKEISKIKKVRSFLKNIKGYKKIKIIKRKKNFGLASNIVNGVTEVLKKEDSAIFLEDDIIVSCDFLKYMNLNLNKYKNTKKIWHISGFNFNVDIKSTETQFFTRVSNCWGWATWSDRWRHFKKNPKRIINNWSKSKIKKFNFDNAINYYSQIERNYNKTLNSWAIFWYATIFEKKGLCVNPIRSLSKNIGHGGNATNTYNIVKVLNPKVHNLNKKIIFPTKVSEDKKIFHTLKKNFFFQNSKIKLKNFINYLLK